MNRLEKDQTLSAKRGETLIELPTEFVEQLTQLIQGLPGHPDYQQVIRETVVKAVEQWQENPSSINNSLIIISSPVAIEVGILTDSLAEWAKKQPLAINYLDWVERPPQPEKISSMLNETLRKAGPDLEENNIAVIPNLSWCFLRSSEGLDGIDYLRDSLLSDLTQFWIIGSGKVAWQYLNSVLGLEAYGADILKLPKLSGEQLQEWLMPIIHQFNIQFDDDSIHERLHMVGTENSQSFYKNLTALLGEARSSIYSLFRRIKKRSDETTPISEEKIQADYFERLSDLSNGVSSTALQLFIKSIYFEKRSEKELDNVQNTERIETQVDSEPPLNYRLIARKPLLPNLPELEQNDLYILYSLLIHGDLTLEALSESVGEDQPIIKNCIHCLRRAGLINQEGLVIKVNPIHYPRLKRQLASENFMVGDID